MNELRLVKTISLIPTLHEKNMCHKLFCLLIFLINIELVYAIAWRKNLFEKGKKHIYSVKIKLYVIN